MANNTLCIEGVRWVSNRHFLKLMALLPAAERLDNFDRCLDLGRKSHDKDGANKKTCFYLQQTAVPPWSQIHQVNEADNLARYEYAIVLALHAASNKSFLSGQGSLLSSRSRLINCWNIRVLRSIFGSGGVAEAAGPDIDMHCACLVSYVVQIAASG